MGAVAVSDKPVTSARTRRHSTPRARKAAFNWGVVQGRIELPDQVVNSAAEMAKSYYKAAEESEFSGDPVEDELLPAWMEGREKWLPHEQLRDLGFRIDMIELEQLLLTVGVDSHIDSIHGPVFILALHNDGLAFRQGRNSHKTKVGEWFVFDDCTPHAVRETDKSTTYLCWSVPLLPVDA